MVGGGHAARLQFTITIYSFFRAHTTLHQQKLVTTFEKKEERLAYVQMYTLTRRENI